MREADRIATAPAGGSESAGDAGALLQLWLRERGVDARVQLLGRATVGLSQETWFVRVESEADSVEAVLRLPTPASGARAIEAQRAALHAVAGRIPAPALLWEDEGEQNPFGRSFIVMERIAGAVPVQWAAVSERARDSLATDAIDVLARLHSLDPGALARSGGETRPIHQPHAALEFHRRRLAKLAPLPAVLELGLWWLERHLPAPSERLAVVHGDFRMGNFLVAGERIVGVLDWEMSGLGDPLVDLAWCFIPLWDLPRVDERRLYARYRERCGCPLDLQRLHWHRVLGYVRLCYYALSGIAAFESGHSDDLRLAALALQLPVHLDRLASTLAGAEVS
ncbi:MAG: phosphotransferase family protein [Solirubrobacteraceae bacterium]